MGTDQVLPVAVPAIVDTLHHRLNPGSLSLKQAMDRALATWHGRPKVHISSQAPDKTGAHAQTIDPAAHSRHRRRPGELPDTPR